MATEDRLLKEIRKRLEAGIDEGLKKVSEHVVTVGSRIISKEAIDRGDLLKSSEVQRIGLHHYRARWTAEHAVYVEFGSRPHWPPKEPIRAWVRRNFRIVATDRSREGVFKPKRKKGTTSPTNAEIDRITYLVQRKIAEQGTPAVRYATRAARQTQRVAGDLLSKEVVDALRGLPSGGGGGGS